MNNLHHPRIRTKPSTTPKLISIVGKCSACQADVTVTQILGKGNVIEVKVEPCLDCSYADYLRGHNDAGGGTDDTQLSKEEFKKEKS